MQQTQQNQKVVDNNQISQNQSELQKNNAKCVAQQSDTNQTLQIANNHNQISSFTRFNQVFQLINRSSQTDLPQLIRQYAHLMIKNQEDQNFFQHFVQKKFIKVLRELMNSAKFSSQIVKAVFQCLQILLKGLKKQDQFVYLMVSISRDGFVEDNYQFVEQQDAAYYANFLKILARKINEDQKYLAVFLNAKQPDFPLLKNLLRFHDSPDIILHTSAKLTIMELFSNKNNNKMLQTYITNFPFVIFYPSYTYPVLQSFQQMIKQQVIDNQESALFHEEALRNDLKFMQDFVSTKDQRHFIHMYVNTFFALIGRKIFRMIQQKDKTHLVLKAIFTIFLKEISVHKIRMGFQFMLEKILNQKMEKYFKSKTYHLDRNYWLLTQCQDSVKEHCRAIFHNDVNKSKKSFMNTVNSYIPKSKSYWFYQQIKKISDIIGVKIQVNYPINHEIQNQSSFIASLDYQNKMVLSPIYQSIVKNDKNEEQIVFWYLKIAKQIDVSVVIQDIIDEIQICTSLCLVKAFYQYIISKDFRQQEQKQKLKDIYEQTIAKLSYFILNEGWKSFLNRARAALLSLNGIASTQQWQQDVFRDVECDIVLFLAMRHLFGTSNEICQQVNSESLENYDKGCVNKLEVNCKWVNSEGKNVKAVMQGQYLKIISENDEIITKEPLILSDYKFYRNNQDKKGYCLTLALKKSSENSFTICFADQSMLDYMIRQFKQRRDRHIMIETELKTMKFPDK